MDGWHFFRKIGEVGKEVISFLLSYEMGCRPVQCLLSKVKGENRKGEIMMGVCYRPPKQGEEVNEAFFTPPLQITTRSIQIETVVLMKTLMTFVGRVYSSVQQPSKFWSVEYKFGIDSIEVLLDMPLINREELVGKMEVEGSLGTVTMEWVHGSR